MSWKKNESVNIRSVEIIQAAEQKKRRKMNSAPEICPETCMYTNIFISWVLEKKGEENSGKSSGQKLFTLVKNIKMHVRNSTNFK